jgi:hypothetical protein
MDPSGLDLSEAHLYVAIAGCMIIQYQAFINCEVGGEVDLSVEIS